MAKTEEKFANAQKLGQYKSHNTKSSSVRGCAYIKRFPVAMAATVQKLSDNFGFK